MDKKISDPGRTQKDALAKTATTLCNISSERFVRKPEVKDRFALSDSALYKKISEGLFPAPIHPHGPRVSVWLESDLNRHMLETLKAIGKKVQA